MTNRKGGITSKCLDKASACSYVNEEVSYFSDERQFSSSSTVSDADSSAIPNHITQAPSSCRECSNGSVNIGAVCVQKSQGFDCAYPDYRDRESTIRSTVRFEKLLRKTGWTDEKHRLYLNSMEAEFVRSLYAQDCCPPCYSQPCQIPSTADSLEEDCAESHPAINTKSYHESEVSYY
ncbi:hypothetical protein O6H91_04G102300 [Diphasiastrum complanatum]|uniref:Uncharacterized protein n=1 Tax=Diphasiastrum complanatum TaxID=34168 RepID=A0ACC2E0B5_DIPCM|nr:hypothetical protein O6H91_04G102300 [Diphasiastrum complanatum]